MKRAALPLDPGESFVSLCGVPMWELSGAHAVSEVLTGTNPAAPNDKIQHPPLRDLLLDTFRLF